MQDKPDKHHSRRLIPKEKFMDDEPNYEDAGVEYYYPVYRRCSTIERAVATHPYGWHYTVHLEFRGEIGLLVLEYQCMTKEGPGHAVGLALKAAGEGRTGMFFVKVGRVNDDDETVQMATLVANRDNDLEPLGVELQEETGLYLLPPEPLAHSNHLLTDVPVVSEKLLKKGDKKKYFPNGDAAILSPQD